MSEQQQQQQQRDQVETDQQEFEENGGNIQQQNYQNSQRNQEQIQQQMSDGKQRFQWNGQGINQSNRMMQNSQSQYFLPNINLSKRKPWNTRFHVSSLNNKAGSHPFYRQYFDKNERVNDHRLLKPCHPEKSFKEIQQVQQVNMMRRSTSQVSINNWDGYFSKMNSKNNEKVHTNFREFFDKPISYDPKGYQGNMNQGPMEVYHRLSPKGKQISRKTSQEFYKSHAAERFLTTNKSVAQLPDHEILQLRKAPSPKQSKMEGKWNQRIGLPISTFNESVYPRYRINFTNL